MKHIVTIFVLLFFSTKSYAWSLKTHLWIAQQVLNDVVDDGYFNMLDKKYPVPQHIYNALKLHPDKFRMGSLGPDVFPDPIVGQTTTHPGVINGWQTDGWLRQILSNAKTAEEIAFSYGFVIHACSDIFAHTYVNAYAGDIFELTDPERDVELRHFVLEKYIESVTPLPKDNNGALIDWVSVLGCPSDYLANTLILNNDVFQQNVKAKTGLHLSSMFLVKKAVSTLNATTNDVISEFTKWAAKYYKLQFDYYGDLKNAELSLKAAEKALEAEAKLLELKRKAYDAALATLEDAKDIVVKYPALIAFQENLLAEQTKVAADLAAESIKVAAQVSGQINSLKNKIDNLRGDITSLACNILIYPPAVKECKKKVKKINNQISDIENQISGLRAQEAAAKKAAQEANNLRNEIKNKVDQLKDKYNNAVKGIAEGTYDAIVFAAETELKSQELVLEKSQKAVTEAQELVQIIKQEIDKIDPIIDEIKKAVDKYNSITLLIGNWLKGIDKASSEYIVASHKAGLAMINNSGNPIDEYSKWFTCYGFVFAGVPIQITETGCFVTDELSKIKAKYDELINSLPEILRWLINPTNEAKNLVLNEVQPELEKAAFNITKFITDPGTAEFMFLLMKPENASLNKLVEVYQQDRTNKRLLTFQDVSKYIIQDLRIENGKLNTDKFGPLVNSVTLSKLALLNPATLNELIKDNVGEYNSPYYGKEIFKSVETNYTLLFDAIKSIDGNHQWQAFALPYPKKGGISTNAAKPNYGYNYYSDASSSKGFRLWVDPYLRERVFYKLFPFSALGSLGTLPELNKPLYTFVECPQNPFPSTQKPNGELQNFDASCNLFSNPNISAFHLPFKDISEYQTKYYYSSISSDNNFYNSAGSFCKKKKAEALKVKLSNQYPDMKVIISKRGSIFNRWRVIFSDHINYENAVVLNDLAIRRQLSANTKIYKSKVKKSKTK